MSFIDVSKYDTGDSVEVAALKAKVQTVAKKYTDKYGWCSEVNRALREMGINNHEPIEVKVSFVVNGLTVENVIEVPVESLLGHDAQGQQEIIAGALPNVQIKIGSRVIETARVSPDDIVSFEVHNDPNGTEGDTLRWWYTSDEGRVLHYLPDVHEWAGRHAVFRRLPARLLRLHRDRRMSPRWSQGRKHLAGHP